MPWLLKVKEFVTKIHEIKHLQQRQCGQDVVQGMEASSAFISCQMSRKRPQRGRGSQSTHPPKRFPSVHCEPCRGRKPAPGCPQDDGRAWALNTKSGNDSKNDSSDTDESHLGTLLSADVSSSALESRLRRLACPRPTSNIISNGKGHSEQMNERRNHHNRHAAHPTDQ